jgi:alcohol dehydrogenase (NADP+)
MASLPVDIEASVYISLRNTFSPLPMIAAKGYAAHSADAPLEAWSFQRRDVGPHDVRFDIDFCGVCHSDLHQARNEWTWSVYPIVPGHELVGHVVEVGSHVTKFKVGDRVGVGCLVDSCNTCANCGNGLEQHCLNGAIQTYNSPDKHLGGTTYGGYSSTVVVTEKFVFRLPDNLPLEGIAPLLCAGITTYSPLRHWKVGAGHKVAILGLGGLGHMAVKFAVSFGAEVTILSTSPSKRTDATQLGAHHFIVSSDADAMASATHSFDFIIDTVSAPHDYNAYVRLLKTDGVLICVGAPPVPAQVAMFGLIMNRISIAGSTIGGVPETQEMLDYCGQHNIVSDIEIIDIKDIEVAYTRMLKGDVRYRFVIDMKTL